MYIKSPFALGGVQIGTGHTLAGNVGFHLMGSVAGRKHVELNLEVRDVPQTLINFLEVYGKVNGKLGH